MGVLVTGGAGYIGSHMVHALKDAGEAVFVLDNLSTGHRTAVPDDVPLIVADTGDEAALRSLLRTYRPEAVIHFAASLIVPESVREPLEYYRNNSANSRTLMAACVDARVRHFIFSSTAAVYGNPEHIPVSEDARLKPISPYGASKMMTEMMLRDASTAHGLGHVILRYFNVAGADPQGRTGQSTENATHLIKVAVQAALGARSHVDVYGDDYPTADGTCIRDYIHVTDLVYAHLAALKYLRTGGPSVTLNCGYGRGYSVLEVIEAVKKVSGRDFSVRPAPPRSGDPATIVADTRRIRERLDWKPRFDDLETIVRHALTWERRLSLTGKVAALLG